MGNFFSRQAMCGKVKFFPGRIIRWIKFNIFNNHYFQGRSDQKSKKKVYSSSDVLFFYRKYRWSSGVLRNFERGP